MKTRKELEHLLKQAQEAEARIRNDVYAAKTARDDAIANEKETRENFADLKRRLHDSEMELARLRGYLSRPARHRCSASVLTN